MKDASEKRSEWRELEAKVIRGYIHVCFVSSISFMNGKIVEKSTRPLGIRGRKLLGSFVARECLKERVEVYAQVDFCRAT